VTRIVLSRALVLLALEPNGNLCGIVHVSLTRLQQAQSPLDRLPATPGEGKAYVVGVTPRRFRRSARIA
jgi:hypothetical protein